MITYLVATTALARRPIMLVLQTWSLVTGFCLMKDETDVPIHNGQEPECAEATITRSFASATREILFGAKALHLCPFGHMESY